MLFRVEFFQLEACSEAVCSILCYRMSCILYSVTECAVYHTPTLNWTQAEKIQRAKSIISFFMSDPIQ